MFCPNCGNNCENANFCPKCGTKLPQQAQNESAVWQIGMPCPHCGGTKLNGNCCAFCGAQLCKAENSVAGGKRRLVDALLGEQTVSIGKFVLKHDGLLLQHHKKVEEYWIPYDEITKVYLEKGAGFTTGWLSIRWKDNSNVPFLTTHWQAIGDEASVLYFPSDNEHYRRIYHALQAIIMGQDSPTGSA